ncbi:MAG: TolB family protein [Solirubrobacteraceae bacterium]
MSAARRPRPGMALALLAAVALAAALALVAARASAGPARPAAHGTQEKIAFWDFVSGQVYTVNADGSGLRQLTHATGGVQAMHPDFSPDGKLIVFGLGDNTHPWRIWVMRSDGTRQRQLTTDTKGFRDNTPIYTPNGRAIVFSRCLPGDGVCAIWEMNADGTHKHALTPYVPSGVHERVDFGAAVSPNGKRIAFTRFFANGIQAQIYLMNADGSNPRPITAPRLEAAAPAWSPNGRWIAFNTNNLRNGARIFAIRPNGKHLRALTPNHSPHNDYGPSYSPNGKQIAFSSDRRHPDGCCLDLFEMRANGSREHKVTLGLRHAGILDPVWQP